MTDDLMLPRDCIAIASAGLLIHRCAQSISGQSSAAFSSGAIAGIVIGVLVTAIFVVIVSMFAARRQGDDRNMHLAQFLPAGATAAYIPEFSFTDCPAAFRETPSLPMPSQVLSPISVSQTKSLGDNLVWQSRTIAEPFAPVVDPVYDRATAELDELDVDINLSEFSEAEVLEDKSVLSYWSCISAFDELGETGAGGFPSNFSAPVWSESGDRVEAQQRRKEQREAAWLRKKFDRRDSIRPSDVVTSEIAETSSSAPMFTRMYQLAESSAQAWASAPNLRPDLEEVAHLQSSTDFMQIQSEADMALNPVSSTDFVRVQPREVEQEAYLNSATDVVIQDQPSFTAWQSSSDFIQPHQRDGLIHSSATDITEAYLSQPLTAIKSAAYSIADSTDDDARPYGNEIHLGLWPDHNESNRLHMLESFDDESYIVVADDPEPSTVTESAPDIV